MREGYSRRTERRNKSVFPICSGVILLSHVHLPMFERLPHMCGGYSKILIKSILSSHIRGDYSHPFTVGARNGISFPYARGYSSIGILLKFSIQSSYIHGVILGEQFQN